MGLILPAWGQRSHWQMLYVSGLTVMAHKDIQSIYSVNASSDGGIPFICFDPTLIKGNAPSAATLITTPID